MEITVYIGNIEVVLGQDEYLEEKVANLKAILNSMEGTEYGTLHLESFTGGTMNVTFTPGEAPVAETEPEVVDESSDGAGTDGTGTAGGTDTADGDGSSGGESTDGTADEAVEDTVEETSSGDPFMAFDSSGTLRYDVRVVNGQAVDSTGTPVPGCSVNEYGYVVDAYMNVIDPATGQPIQQ